LSYSTTAFAQPPIVIDWATRTLVSSPPEIGRTLSSVVRVINVNDVVYDYTVDIVEVRRAIDDFAALGGAIAQRPPGAPSADVCRTDDARTEMTAATTAIGGLAPQLKEGKYESIPVEVTVAAWARNVAPHVANVRTLQRDILEKLNLNQCSDRIAAQTFLGTGYPAFENRIAPLERKIAGPHVVEVPITLRADTDYTLIVTEKFSGVATADGAKRFTFSPASAVLTLSAGFGATRLEGRAYDARTTPGANPGDPVRTTLAVSGLGTRPVVVTLLNYQIPGADRGDYGLAVSTGPVFAFSTGTSNSASLGVFVGISGHLFRRFFVTPGIHLGEFADTPAGFNGDGAAIPDKFGELVPRKQWKTRFAIMFTYRTVDLAKATPKPKVETPAAKPAAGDKAGSGDNAAKDAAKSDKKDEAKKPGGGSWL